MGRPRYLSDQEEKRLVNGLIQIANFGFGYTNRSILETIHNHIQTNQNEYVNFKGGFEWLMAFKRRWNSLISERIAQNMPLTRVISCTQIVVTKFFCLLSDTLTRLDLKTKPTNIWNCDESGFQCDPGSQKIICKRGDKRPITILGNGEKNSYTTMSCCNANGDFLPSLILFKGINLWNTWLEDGPVNARFNVSSSGWMEEDTFF